MTGAHPFSDDDVSKAEEKYPRYSAVIINPLVLVHADNVIPPPPQPAGSNLTAPLGTRYHRPDGRNNVSVIPIFQMQTSGNIS